MSEICYECFRAINDAAVCPYCGFRVNEYVVNERILPPGVILNGKYIVGRTLGEGGFGITYLAWDQNMETRIAIKEYYPSSLVYRDVKAYGSNTLHTVSGGGQEDFQAGLQRYVKEAAILSKFFNLPGIVSVKDFFYENGTAYMAMEYIDGISLKDYLQQKGNTVSVTEALEIVKPIIVSLAVVHNNKLLHRDISPDNIMISKEGLVKLIDFGAARYFEGDSDKSMTVVLKHGYAPIEQYSRKSMQGEATDIYSLCAVIYRMITGTIPEEALERVHHDHLVPMKQFNKKIPTHIVTAIEKGLSVDYKDRQQSMQELYNDLYATKRQLKAKREDKVYAVIRKALVCLIVFLLFVIAGSVFFITNRDKITNFESRLERVFSEDEEQDRSQEEEISRQITKAISESSDSDSDEDESAQTEKDEKVQAGDDAESEDSGTSADDMQENQETAQNITTISNQDTSAEDQELEHALLVVRQGILNGKSDEYTVEDIMNQYCDRIGNWSAGKDEAGNIYVVFSGSKAGEMFTLEFQVFSGDTFKLTGATQNGQVCERYSDFFQEILDEVGV